MPQNLRSAIVVALVILGSIVGLLIASLQLANTNDWIEHAIEVKLAIAQLRVDILLMNKGVEDYALTGDPERLEIYRNAKGSVRGNVDRVRFSTLDNPAQKGPIDGIDARVTEQMVALQEIVDTRDREGRDAAIRAFEVDLRRRGFENRTALLAMMAEEDRVLALRRARARTQAMECVAAVSLASILGAFLIAFALNTRRVQAEVRQTQEAKRAQLEAENSALSERARVTAFQERFIGMLGHDLRNPLGALSMGIDLLQHSVPGEKRILDRMASSSKRMTRMIDQLLDLTRSRLGGGIELTPAPMDLAKLTNEIVDELHTQMPEPRVRVKSSGDLKGEWDADRLAQVLSNLVGNALHHGAPEKKIEIDLDGTGSDVTFSIQNEGAPISPALQSVLFDPFRRGEQGNSSKTAGVGLGLFISKEIVARHGGSIEVTSADARTMFRFTLPRSVTQLRSR